MGDATAVRLARGAGTAQSGGSDPEAGFPFAIGEQDRPGSLGLLAVKLAVSPTRWPDPAGALAIAGRSGVVAGVVPFALYTAGPRGLPAGTASTAATLDPAVAGVPAAAMLHQGLAPLQLVGAAAVLGGVALLAVPAPRGAGRGTDRIGPGRRGLGRRAPPCPDAGAPAEPAGGRRPSASGPPRPRDVLG